MALHDIEQKERHICQESSSSAVYPILLRGVIVNRAYGTHKNLHIYLFLLTIFGPIYYGPP